MTGKTLALVLLLLTLLRAGLVGFGDLSADEAYYALCAAHPAPAYFDGPPGAAALTAVPLLPGGGESWRFWAPVWAALATLACFLLVRAMAGPARAVAVALTLNALPAFNAEALHVGPALPALALCLFGLWCGWLALHADHGAPGRWAAAGIFFAAAVQFSYLALAIPLGLVLFVSCSRKHRRVRDMAGAIGAFALPLLGLVSALTWNAAHEWVPLFPDTLRATLAFRPRSLGTAVGTALVAISPLLFVMAAAWGIALREARAHPRGRFIALSALPALLVAAFLVWRGQDPTLPLLLVAPLLLTKTFAWLADQSAGRAVLAAGIALAAGLSLWTSRQALAAGNGWRAAAAGLKEAFLQGAPEGGEGLFLIAADAPLAAAMSFYLKDDLMPPAGHPTVYEVESQSISSQFGLWPGYDDFVESTQGADEFFTEQKGENPFLGRSALYVSRESEIPQAIKGAFEAVTFLKELPPVGHDTRPLRLFFCKSYQTLPL